MFPFIAFTQLSKPTVKLELAPNPDCAGKSVICNNSNLSTKFLYFKVSLIEECLILLMLLTPVYNIQPIFKFKEWW